MGDKDLVAEVVEVMEVVPLGLAVVAMVAKAVAMVATEVAAVAAGRAPDIQTPPTTQRYSSDTAHSELSQTCRSSHHHT